MHRFYADEILNGLAPLSPDDARHALKVLRLSPGAETELISGGRRYRAVLRENAVLEPLEELPSTEPALRITLFQGLPKGDKMDLIVQKAVEVGVVRIVPVLMERCVVRLSPSDADRKTLRWNRIAREAGKQSGRCTIPEVLSPLPLDEVLLLAGRLDACVVPWEEETALGPLHFSASHPGLTSLGILIGPEGGIAAGEIEKLKSRFCPLTLGPRILRTETAGLCAASVFLALRGEMEGSA